MRKKVGQWLSNRSRHQIIWLSVLLSLLIGAIDYAVRIDLSLSFFYLLPIVIVAWYADLAAGIGISVLCSLVWLCADISVKNYSYVFLPIWNAGVRLGFFLLISYLMVLQHQTLKKERQLARIDELTGIYNRRFFIEILKLEMERSRRYRTPLTLAYLDIDNFKAINDTWGHQEGDRLLKAVSKLLPELMRVNDIVGRLGGDEFGIILPQLEFSQGYSTLARIHVQLTSEISRDWPVGFSIGAITFLENPASADDAIAQADQVMYEIKRKGKNALDIRMVGSTQPIQQLEP